MAIVDIEDDEDFFLTEGSDPGAAVGSSEQFTLTETAFVDTGAFLFVQPFVASPTDSDYTALINGELVSELVLWADAEYPVITATLLEPDGGVLLDGTETVTFDATSGGESISRACTVNTDGTVSFSWEAGDTPGVYRARWTVITETRRLSVPTIAVILRLADQP